MRFRLAILGVLLLAGAGWSNPAAAPVVSLRQLQEGGDCLGDEILAWQRLRAERRTVVEQDDSPPIACIDGAGCVYLVTGSGKLMTSDDGGQNFVPAVQIMVDGQAVQDVQALGVLRSTTPRRLWLGRPRGPVLIAYAAGGRLFLARSDNDGQSWEAAGDLTIPGYGRLQAGGVRILQLKEGQLLLAVAAWPADNTSAPEGLILTSSDAGQTWSKWGSLGPRCTGANLLQLKSGELLAAMTYQGTRREGDPGTDIPREELFNNVVVARSPDGGKSWEDYQCVTRYKESPGDLTELGDGTVVLTYGQQNFPYGCRALISKDGGQTWDKQVYILGYSTVWAEWYAGAMHATEPGWRVSAVALKNTLVSFYTRGSLIITKDMLAYPTVTEWYAKNGSPGEKGKAVQSVRWTLAGMQKPSLSFPGIIGKLNKEGFLDNGRRLINPEHLNEGGDYFFQDEVLRYARIPAERHIIGPGAEPILMTDPDGHPFIYVGNSLYRSGDCGRTWEVRGMPATAPGIVGILRDHSMLGIKSTRIERKPTGSLELGMQVFRSADGGKTWENQFYISPPGSFDQIGTSLHVCQTHDGTVLMGTGAAVSRCEGNESSGFGSDYSPTSVVYRSQDGGRTWEDWRYGGCDSMLDPGRMTILRSGRIISAARHDRPFLPDDVIRSQGLPQSKYRINMLLKNVMMCSSDDNGYNWTLPRTVTRYFECPGDFVETADSTVVLSYQQKNEPGGSRAMTSRDGGLNWDKTSYMLGWWKNSGGMATSVLLRDGRVLTLNAGWSPGDKSQIVEATIWQPLAAD